MNLKTRTSGRFNLWKILLCCCALFALASLCTSQKLVAESLSPETLKQIQFDQKLGAQVSLDLPFHDEFGRDVRLRNYFVNKPAILILGYYHCPMLCSFVLNGMIGSLQDMKWTAGNQFDIIYVSIDPNETPALAAAKKTGYVKRYGRPNSANGWHFLTGDETSIRRLAREVGYGYAYDSSIKQYAHPSGLVILTGEGKVSQYLSGVVFSTKQLSEALSVASSRQVGSPISQLFLLCFHYSPIGGKYGSLVMLIVRVTGVVTILVLAKFIFTATRGVASVPPKTS